jgi:alanine-synthesizing transaminase
VAHFYQEEGLTDVTVDDVYIGNGVSEMISMTLQALVDNGDEILIPAPDYPLWTAAVTLSGGKAVHYRCDEANGWNPSLEDIEGRITSRTRAIVLINPNNPTGAVYSEEIVRGFVELASKHDLVLMADEIYEKILYDGARHVHAATYAHDILCLTFSGLSKAYRVAGFRSGWLVVTGARERAADFLEGLTLLANMRMCANVPAQHAIQTALGGHQSIKDLILPGGRLLAQRDLAHQLMTDIPGVSCVKPQGALYLFPRLDPEVYAIEDDQAFVIELLRSTHILITNGTGFNWPTPDHVRIVTLPSVEDLRFAIERIAGFLETKRR